MILGWKHNAYSKRKEGEKHVSTLQDCNVHKRYSNVLWRNLADQSFLLGLELFDLDGDLEISLNADGQKSLTLHIPQLGLRGVQTVCPNPTCLNTNQNTKCIY